jgi:hypothetical protein
VPTGLKRAPRSSRTARGFGGQFCYSGYTCASTDAGCGTGTLGCLPGVVARPSERRGDDVGEAKGSAGLCDPGELFWRPPARYWEVAGGRAQVLADRHDLHADRLQVGKHTDDFFLGLAQPDHQP